MQRNGLWGEPTAAAALLAGVIVSVAGVVIMLELDAYLFGAVLVCIGALAAGAAFLAYRC